MAEVRMNKKKKIGIIALFLLILLSLSAYFTVQWVNAKTIEDNLELGQKYYDQGNYEEAIIAYENVLDIEPKHVKARIGLAKSYAALEKVEKAAEVLVAGISLIPKEPSFYLELAELYLSENNILEAIKTLDDGVASTNDKEVEDLHTKTSSSLELVVDKTVLQVGESSNMKIIYHSQDTEADEAESTTDEQGDSTSNPDSTEVSDESTSDAENEKSDKSASETDKNEENTSQDTKDDEQEKSNEASKPSTVSVVAKWELENRQVGSLKNDEGDTNVFTSEKSGNETVTANVGSVALTTELEVKDHVLTTIKVSASQESAKVGDSIEFTAVGKDVKGNEMEINPEWVIDNGSGTLEKSIGTTNILSDAEVGTTEIVVSQDDIFTTVKVTVEENEYTLYKIALGNGTISSNPTGNTFTEGQSVTLTATPSSGWEFDHWEGSVRGTNKTVSITMNSDHTAKAVFKKIPQYTLFTSVSGEGGVQVSPAKENYIRGSVVNVKAVPANGWKFDHWEGDISGKNPEVNITMNNSKSVRAVFVKNNYSLTVEVEGQGTVTKTPNQNSYVTGTVVTLKANAKEGWKFDHWEGNISGKNPEVKITIDKSKSVKAVFVNTRSSLTVEVEGQGTVTKTPNQDLYENGTVVTLKAIPAEGWQFARWEGAATGTNPEIEVTVDKTKTFKAVFTKIPVDYPLSVEIEGQGTVSKTPDQNAYREGSTVRLQAVPAEGWAFLRWEGDASGSTNPLTLTIDRQKQVKAVFAQVGNVTGVIKNSRTGGVIKDVQVKLRNGENAQTGQVVAQAVTLENGSYTINKLLAGTYTMELSANGYHTKYATVIINANATATKNENIMPVAEEITEFSVVLTWDSEPRDLDSHLTGPISNSDDRFHVYFGNRQHTENGVVYAELDTDETGGFGPETITTFKEVDGVYRYFVYNWTGTPSISESGAVVELYKDGRVVQTFRVPQGQVGRYWHVFEINHGQIVPINQLADQGMQ